MKTTTNNQATDVASKLPEEVFSIFQRFFDKASSANIEEQLWFMFQCALIGLQDNNEDYKAADMAMTYKICSTFFKDLEHEFNKRRTVTIDN
jgi:hypothetical protein